jgi:hypothetical protein
VHGTQVSQNYKVDWQFAIPIFQKIIPHFENHRQGLVDIILNYQQSHPGIILKAGDDIENYGSIYNESADYESSMLNVGATIQLTAADNIVNWQYGWISASAYDYRSVYDYPVSPVGALGLDGPYDYTSGYNANAIGGIIISRAGNINANLGSIESNGEATVYHYGIEVDGYDHAGDGQGGYIHLHGGNVAGNLNPYYFEGYYKREEGSDYGIHADGTAQGGQVIMSAGGNDNGGLTEVIGDLIPEEYAQLPGFSFTQPGVTPPVTGFGTTVDLTRGESVFNFGGISAEAYYNEGGDGDITLVANQQIGIGQGASFNYNYLESTENGAMSDLTNLFDNAQSNGGTVRLIVGENAVNTILCGFIPQDATNPTGNNENVPGFGSPKKDPDFNTFGLFQPNRPGDFNFLNPPQNGGGDGTGLLIGYAEPNMFFAKEYGEVTEDILAISLQIYTDSKSKGMSEAEAIQAASDYLKDAGVTPEVASNLLKQISDGTINAAEPVVGFLKKISEEAQAASAS